MKTEYGVEDVILAEINLEPLVCRHCNSLEVTFNQLVADGYCADCGEWQKEN